MMVAFPNDPSPSIVGDDEGADDVVEEGPSSVGAVAVPEGADVFTADEVAKRYPLTWTPHTRVAAVLVVDQEPVESD